MPYISKKPQKEWQVKLQEEFPFMKRDMTATDVPDNRWNLYQMFGFECGEGWSQLLHDLCQEITDRYAEADILVDIVVEQVKEKFARLRFYYSFTDAPMKIHAFDSLTGGGIRFRPKADGEDEKRNQLRRDIAAIVDKYEEKSGEVCEKCGQQGTVRKDLLWIVTLCDTCYQEHLDTIKERTEKQPISDFLE